MAAIAVFLRFPDTGAPSAISIGMGLTKNRLRLARLPQRPSPAFFRRLRLCTAKQKSRHRPPSTSFQPYGCGPIVPGLTTPIEVAMVRPDRKRNTTMATIGTFTKNEDGAGFTGAVKTLTLNVKAKFILSEGESERGPDFRIFAGATEFGAAWKKTARETQREYLSVKLDDPSFPAPIYASLVEAEDGSGHNLIWSRRNGD
jgi:uncharacterized protein (DUF736 family)